MELLLIRQIVYSCTKLGTSERSYNMQILTYSEARNNFKSVLDRTIDDADITVIHRRVGEDAVLMGRSQYDSLMETLYLLSNPANATTLMNAIAQDKAHLAQPRQLLADDK
jgi:antitoxin YefM